MFYQESMDEMLRFGDVLQGYILAAANIDEPNSNKNYKIDINLPTFCVIISPCCSIGDKMISLSPLIKLYGAFFNNPYFAEDLTRINREMEPQETVAPKVWEDFPEQEKEKRLKEGYAYAFLEFFVYDKNELFPNYTVHRKEENIKTNYYMIDFRNTFKVSCEKIITPKDAPLESKLLQLSIQSRSELRDKLAYYYGKVPEEDMLLED